MKPIIWHGVEFDFGVRTLFLPIMFWSFAVYFLITVIPIEKMIGMTFVMILFGLIMFVFMVIDIEPEKSTQQLGNGIKK